MQHGRTCEIKYLERGVTHFIVACIAAEMLALLNYQRKIVIKRHLSLTVASMIAQNKGQRNSMSMTILS